MPDLLLTSQSPIGELLAVPETESLRTAVCLLDVDDTTRLHRLNQRDPGMWSAERKHAFIAWGHWHRGHAGDPTHHPEVITRGSAPWMRWDRWQCWTADHPEWHVDLIDCSELTIKATQNQLANWVSARRSEAARLRDPGSRNTDPGA